MRRILLALERADRAIARAEAAILAGAVLALAAINVANVLARNALGRSFSSAEELSQICAVAVTFIGVGYAARIDRHIRMSALRDLLPPRARRALDHAVRAGTGALLLALAVFACDYVADTWAVASVTPALRLPLYAVYAVVPLGLALGGLQYAIALAQGLLAPSPPEGAPTTAAAS